MNRRSFFLAAMLALAGSPAAALEPAAQFALDLAEQISRIIADHAGDPAEQQRRLRQLLHDSVERESISRFVLGPYWRTASEQQRREFVDVFEDYVVQTYAVRIAEHGSQRVREGSRAAPARLNVLASRPESDSVTLVNSQVIRTDGGPPVKLDWRIARTPSGFKVDDLIVEGISMKLTQRQEFSAVMQRSGGLDGLIRILRERIRAQG
jgi:phospholipid transport system substrate-binding protein